VYGLGAILYEILAGEPPFTGPEESVVLDRVKHEATTPPRQRVPGTSPALDAICLKALAKKREERYGSAKELAQEIEHWLGDEPVAAYPEPWIVKVRRWLGRHPTLATAAAAAIIVAGLAVTVILLETANRGLSAEKQKTEDALGNEKNAVEAKETSLYFKRILLAEREWLANNIEGAKNLLAECPKHLRGWEWHYLKNRISSGAVLTLSGHKEVVVGVAVSSDSRLIATSSLDSTVKVWNAANGNELHTLQGHTGYVFGVAFSPDNQFLASCSGQADTGPGEIIVWNLETGKPVFEPIKGNTGFGSRIAYSPNGKSIASTCGDLEKRSEVRLWNAATGKSLGSPLTGDGQGLLDVVFSPDGRYVAASSGTLDFGKPYKPPGNVIIWDTETRKKVKTLSGHTGSVSSLAFSPDGQRLASGSWDMTVKTWDAPTWSEHQTIWGHSHFVTSVAFNKDGTKITSAAEDGMVKVWDAATGESLRTYRGHTRSVQGVKFLISAGAPDVERLVSVSEDLTGRIWDLRNEQEATSLTGDGTWLTCLAYSPNGKYLAVGGVNKTVKIYDAKTNNVLQTLEGHSGAVRGVAFGPNNESLAVACGDWGEADRPGEVRIWNLRTKTCEALPVQIGPAWCVAISKDGRHLAAGTGNWSNKNRKGKIYLWKTSNFKETRTLEGHVALVASVAFNPDGQSLASGGGESYTPGEVKVWNIDTGKEVPFSNPSNNTQSVVSVAYSPDGKYLASGLHDTRVILQNAQTGEVIYALQGHTHEVTAVAFSPDSKRLVSSSLDTTVKLWDTNTGQEILTLRTRRRPSLIYVVTFSPNNEQIVSGGMDGIVRIWDAGSLNGE
jgi:WD40 repeat protein